MTNGSIIIREGRRVMLLAVAHDAGTLIKLAKRKVGKGPFTLRTLRESILQEFINFWPAPKQEAGRPPAIPVVRTRSIFDHRVLRLKRGATITDCREQVRKSLHARWRSPQSKFDPYDVCMNPCLNPVLTLKRKRVVNFAKPAGPCITRTKLEKMPAYCRRCQNAIQNAIRRKP